MPLLAPVAIAALAWVAGGEAAHDLLRSEWSLPTFSFAWWSVAVRFEALVVLAWLLVGGVRFTRPLGIAAGIVTTVALAFRVGTLVSFATLPADAGWSEAPLLLNLLKVRVGVPFYGPFEECNSYQYNPTFELVHHALLAPFGLDLSLLANRFLGLCWQLFTAAILTIVLVPFARGRPTRALITVTMLLVALSSFIAWNLHPDHLLMPWFALALGVALHRDRLPPRVVLAALVVLPAIAAAVKLTGAGIGVGLVLVLGWPLQRARLVAAAAGAALAFGVLTLYEHWFPRFFQYTVALQASHVIAWGGLSKLPFEAPARLLVVALVALALTRPGDARRDATRVLVVTFGFALPSLLAYLKVGGRANSLLPLTIGSAVAIARLGLALADARGAVIALWGALTVTPTMGPVPSALRDEVTKHHARAVALVRSEVAAGRRTLLYESSLAWIEAGQRDVPRDRWQSVSELVMGHHREADASFARIAAGTYDSVIISDSALDPSNVYGDRLAATIARGYVLVDEPARDDGSTLPSIHLFHAKPRR